MDATIGHCNISPPFLKNLRGPLKPSVARLFDKYYSEWDPLYFARKVRSSSRPGTVILDLGAGRGDVWPHGLRGAVRRLVGLDPSHEIAFNQEVDQGVRGRSETLPFRDETFDVVFSHYVVEHLADPRAAFLEMARVLKRGGTLLLQTPNLWHYSMLLSRLTPYWFHRRYLSMLGTRAGSKDTFPTFYRANTARVLRRILSQCGLKTEELELLASPPGYLRFSPVAFLLGTLYERTFERVFPNLRAALVAVARKEGSPLATQDRRGKI